MNRLLISCRKDFFTIFKIAYQNIKYFLYKILGKKVIIYNLHYDYIYHIFEPIFLELKKDSRFIVFFSYSKSYDLKKFLLNRVSSNYLIESHISPFVYSDLFIASEVVGPDFPASIFTVPRLQIYHGMGVNHIKKHKSVLDRFYYHFMLGPHYSLELNSVFGETKEYFDIGFPKSDSIFLDNRFKLKNRYKTILYAPHWNVNSSLHYILKDFEKLLELDTFILIKPHNYLFSDFYTIDYHKIFLNLSKKSPRIIYLTYGNTQDFYKTADMLLTDCYTTVVEEFTITEKPIVAFNSNEWFIENKKYSVKIEQDFLKSLFLVDNLDDAIFTINSILDGTIKLKYKLQKKLLKKYFYNLGNSTKKAVEAIETILYRR